MAIAEYPVELLHSVMRDAYAEDLVSDGRIAYPPERGPPMTRLMFSSATRETTFTSFMYTHETAVLEDFWQYDIVRGSKPFVMPDLRWDNAMWMDDEGNIITDDEDIDIAVVAWWLAIFKVGEKPSIVPFDDPDYWRVTHRLTLLPH